MIKTNTRCKAKLKSGSRCSYAARRGSKFCGRHHRSTHSSKEQGKNYKKETAKNLALIVSTGLALVQLVEKAVAHYPALVQLLESFREFTGNRWRAATVVRDLKAVELYKRDRNLDELKLISGNLLYGRGKLQAEADAENISTVLLVHNIALTNWASSTVLSKLAGDHGDFRRHGDILDEGPVNVSQKEKRLLLEIYHKCRALPFIDELRTSNFESMWDYTTLDADFMRNQTE